MALEDKTDTIVGRSYVLELLASRTTTNGSPSGAAAGIDCNLFARNSGVIPDAIRVGVKST